MYLKLFTSMYVVGLFTLLLFSTHSSQTVVSPVTILFMITVFFAGMYLFEQYKNEENLSKMMRTFYKTSPFALPLVVLLVRQIAM